LIYGKGRCEIVSMYEIEKRENEGRESDVILGRGLEKGVR
jgi:hypothetical protein